MERLARVLFPRPDDSAEVSSLYLLATGTGGGLVSASPGDDSSLWTASSRTSATFAAGTRVSFETYFGAFPAAYWQHWSQLREVMLRVELSGSADVEVYASNAAGTSRLLASRSVGERDSTENGASASASADVPRHHVDIAIPLAICRDGGWFWFELTTHSPVTIHSAGWWAILAPGPQILPGGGVAPAPEAKVTVGIPTFNRPSDAVAAIAALGEDPEVNAVIDALIMPDQGDRHPADEPGWDEAIARFGDRFRLLHQGNLGGSGGYSRIMFEALGGVDGTDNPTSAPYILFMDDDIAIEPDAVLRAVQVARYARGPMLVGGQMLNLMQRSHLHSMGEAIHSANFMWGPALHTHYDHDFARVPLGLVEVPSIEKPLPYTSRDLHRRIDVDFNGWWMCLIPRRVAEEIGQPLPLFIKWDDAEYGLRAARAGYRTATWPGVAIWHMAWGNKDNEIDWQSFFFLRNRLTVAALYGGNLGGLVADQLKVLGKHVMCMEYSTIALHNEALRAFLAGPAPLPAALLAALGNARSIQQSFSDGRVVDAAQFAAKRQAEGSSLGMDGTFADSVRSTGTASAAGDSGETDGMSAKDGQSVPDGQSVKVSTAVDSGLMKSSPNNDSAQVSAASRPMIDSQIGADTVVTKPSLARQAFAFGKTMLHQLRRPRITAEDAAVNPEKILTSEQARWFALVGVDAAAVLNATGTGATIRHRDRAIVGTLVKEQVRLLAEVRRRADELKGAYQQEHAHLVSRELWQEIFAEDTRRRGE